MPRPSRVAGGSHLSRFSSMPSSIAMLPQHHIPIAFLILTLLVAFVQGEIYV